MLVPPWWTRPGARPRSEVTLSPKGKRLRPLHPIDSLVEFDWAVALGDETLTPDEFARLAALKTPLIQVKGQWVELRPGDAEAALRFWQRQGQGGQLRLRDALRLGLAAEDGAGAAPPAADGTPCRATACPWPPSNHWLAHDPFDQLRGPDRPPRAAAPRRLQGTLRPYQVRGLSWLAFMRRWGLGALPGRRHGPGQDGATVGAPAARPRRGWGLGVGGWGFSLSDR